MAASVAIRPSLRQAYLLGLMMMAVGLTLSPFLMSLSQFWLAIVWIVDGTVNKDFKKKWQRFLQNKAALLFVAFYLMHVIGLFYTSDFQYAIKDLRVKLPLLILPFIMSGMPHLDRKRFDLLMMVYVFSVFVATLFSTLSYYRNDYEDIREISRFISHIRFCLNIVFCIAITGYYIVHKRVPNQDNVVMSKTRSTIDLIVKCFLILWFVFQIYIFESLSGYVILAAVVIVTAFHAFLRWKNSRNWRITLIVVAAVVVAIGTIVTLHITKSWIEVEPVDFSHLEQTTAQGHPYCHDTVHQPVEDGQYVGLYYCREELQTAWSERSPLPFDGTTNNGENLEATLARYLTSKHLRKDAEGVTSLTNEDISNIEQGIANYNNWRHPGFRARLSATLFEYNLYRRFNNPNGGSLAQRFEFTRAAFNIIRQHPLFGVGTGDVPQAFRQAYNDIQSPLSEEYRFRAHNQFLSIMIAFGAVGLALFLIMLLYPCFSSKKHRTYLYLVFLCIMILSMLPEDTLETQAGASLFAFFNALLLCAAPENAPKEQRSLE